MKHISLTTQPILVTSFALLLLAFFTPLTAHAQQRTCVVDDYTWQVSCGRYATRDEINLYNRRNQNYNDSYNNNNNYNNNYQENQRPINPNPPRTDVWHQNNQNSQINIAPTIIERKTERSQDRPNSSSTDSNVSDRDLGVIVNRMYQEVLGRSADNSGLNTHISQLRNGKSINDIRASLAASAEAKQAINRQYNQVLGRNGDPAGLNHYQQKLIAGATLTDIRNALADSEEGRKRR
jgi:hypothetical protein